MLRCLRAIAVLAALLDRRSVSNVTATIALAPSVAVMPMTGWNRNRTIKNIGIQGISRNAVGPIPDKKARI